MINQQAFFSLVESFHLDFVLSAMIHVGQRDSVNHSGLGTKYFSTLLVSLFCISLLSMYLFMAYTVSRITKSRNEYFLLKIKEMKTEPYRFWLEDKKHDGNIFQRHFNLIMLLKDIYICSVLYALYYKSALLIILVSLMQFTITFLTIVYQPYIRKSSNQLLIISQSLYSLLNISFFINILGGKRITEETRYFFIGFTMIVIVSFIILVTIGFSLVINFKDTYQRCVKKKQKNKVKAQDGKPKNIESSGIDNSAENIEPSEPPKNRKDDHKIKHDESSDIFERSSPEKAANISDITIRRPNEENGNGEAAEEPGVYSESIPFDPLKHSGNKRMRKLVGTKKVMVARENGNARRLPEVAKNNDK